MQKKCHDCGDLKDISPENFHYKTSSSDGYTGRCKPCSKQYGHQRYTKNKDKVYARNIERRKFLAQEVDKLKDFPCVDCGIKYEPSCMDFDHLYDKVMAVSKMIHETFSLENIKKEIAKCELVCVLCHKNRTHQRHQVKGRKQQYPCYDRNRAIVVLAKDTECAICGIKRDYWQMEFDHITIDKEAAVGDLMSGSAEKIHAEINKCQVLCSLCHRRKTKQELWDKT